MNKNTSFKIRKENCFSIMKVHRKKIYIFRSKQISEISKNTFLKKRKENCFSIRKLHSKKGNTYIGVKKHDKSIKTLP